MLLEEGLTFCSMWRVNAISPALPFSAGCHSESREPSASCTCWSSPTPSCTTTSGVRDPSCSSSTPSCSAASEAAPFHPHSSHHGPEDLWAAGREPGTLPQHPQGRESRQEESPDSQRWFFHGTQAPSCPRPQTAPVPEQHQHNKCQWQGIQRDHFQSSS